MIKYGICMDGNEPAFERALFLALRNGGFRSRPFYVVEIGTAAAETTAGMAKFIHGVTPHFEIDTFDIPNGWSLVREAVAQVCANEPRIRPLLSERGAQSLLEPDADWPTPIDFAFIDGCHGAPCATTDFLVVEKYAVKGTVVVFHDTSTSCQGIHLQPHCQTGIDVRRALIDMGLLNNTRPGWRLVEETNTPHGIAVFERIV
jgi:hypothetical protein